jgi:hypothetical protein
MRLYEKILDHIRSIPDGVVERLVLGWHGSCVLLRDGRCGIGTVPLPGHEVLRSVHSHTENLLRQSARGLAELLVSPFPQEFAAASAAAAALLPPPEEGLPLETLRPLPRGGKVALLGYDAELVPLLRGWEWNLAIFDDLRSAPDVFPTWSGVHLAGSCSWAWISAEALRDRQILSLMSTFKTMEGCILQGPGIPWSPEVLKEVGITHLLLPTWSKKNVSSILTYLEAGGNPLSCPSISWRVHALLPASCPKLLPFPQQQEKVRPIFSTEKEVTMQNEPLLLPEEEERS